MKKGGNEDFTVEEMAGLNHLFQTAETGAITEYYSIEETLNPAVLEKIDPRERYEMIAKMAYFRAERRGFEPGWETEDWFESEKIVDEMLGKIKD